MFFKKELKNVFNELLRYSEAAEWGNLIEETVVVKPQAKDMPKHSGFRRSCVYVMTES
jgi:hypothetical protein